MRRRDLLGVGAGLAGSLLLPRGALGDALIEYTGAPQQNLATPTRFFDRLITPTDVFFVRSHFGPPALDRRRKVKVEGARKTLELGVDELRKNFKEVKTTLVLQCAGNGRSSMDPKVPGVQWDHGAMGQAEWTGVRLADVLEAAGVPPDAAWVSLRGADLPNKPTVPAFIRGLPLSRALDPTTLLAYRMNGEPLSLAHGAPLRVVVPGWAGDHWVKWLVEVRAQAAMPGGFYMETAYRYPKSPVAPGQGVKPEDMELATAFPVKSLIARPADGGTVAAGPQEVVGVAFSGLAPIARVEVSTDGGESWRQATLEGEPGIGRWQVFRHRFEAAKPGAWRVLSRATDARGNAQPQKAQWNPSGYFWNAWHSVSFTVKS